MAAGNVIPYTVNMTDPAVSGGVDLDSDTIVCVLLSASYTPGRTTHSTWADVSAYEVTGTNYHAGGQALANKTMTHSGGTVNSGGSPSTLTKATRRWPCWTRLYVKSWAMCAG